ncbi:unnamed protein product [Lactuca virosa]|uniref:Uncharacterized protein n=1 Tax=Lactuca virosa TaxID=75947 RepID=A0AAU9MPP8_9ASTR|nr:unnamed protein product [Lactuca virosa]
MNVEQSVSDGAYIIDCPFLFFQAHKKTFSNKLNIVIRLECIGGSNALGWGLPLKLTKEKATGQLLASTLSLKPPCSKQIWSFLQRSCKHYGLFSIIYFRSTSKTIFSMVHNNSPLGIQRSSSKSHHGNGNFS